MPNSARILQFRPGHSGAVKPVEEASSRAASFLSTPTERRSPEFLAETLCDADVLSCLVATLSVRINTAPATVIDEASSIYRWLSGRTEREFFFDERDYFMGEFALLSGASCRLVGRRDEAEGWLDRSDASFRHTVAPGPHLARVSFNRLALRFDMSRFADVLEL